MPFEVPPLPYDYGALEPTIDEQTMRIHHDKHHQAYVDNANKALAGRRGPTRPVEDILKSLDQIPDDKRAAVRNNAGGHANHSLFWQVMAPGGGTPSGDLAAAIGKLLGSVVDATILAGLGGMDGLKEKLEPGRDHALRQRLGLARLERLGPRDHVDGQPGQPAVRGQDAAPRDRRLGARLLPEVPEPPSGLRRRLVGRRQLGRGRPSLRRRASRLTVRDVVGAGTAGPHDALGFVNSTT